MNQTICWNCKNSVPDPYGKHGCSWSRKFAPVEGWDAIPTYHAGNDSVYLSYEVKSCPQFVPDDGYTSIAFAEILSKTPRGQERIPIYRLKLGMTQRFLADNAGITRDRLYRIEKGYVIATDEELDAMCKLLGTVKKEFIKEEENDKGKSV